MLNLKEVLFVAFRDEVDSQAQMPEAPAAPDPVEVGLAVPREVEVDDDVDGLDVDSSGAEIRADEAPALPLPEAVEDIVALLLGHFGVDVEAGVPDLEDFLGEKLDSHGRVAEDDGLRDVQFAKQRVEAVDLVLLINEGVVRGHSLKGELLHHVDGFASL